MSKHKYRKRAKTTVPLFIALPAGIMAMDIGKKAFAGDMAGLQGKYLGVWEDGKFNAGQIVSTYAPLGVGVLLHAVASKSGLNRALGKAKVPLIRG